MESYHMWSATLNKSKKEKQWVSSEDDNLRTLCLSNIFLGEPSTTEQNVVKVEYADVDGEPVNCTLCILQKGKMESLALNLKTTEDLKIVLAQGSGPIHVTAYQANQSIEDFDDDDASMEGEEEEEMMSEESPVKKLPSAKKSVEQKKALIIPSDDDEDSEEEEEVKAASPPAKKKKLDVGAVSNEKGEVSKDKKKGKETQPPQQVSAPAKALPDKKKKLPEIEIVDDDDDEDDEDDSEEDEEMPQITTKGVTKLEDDDDEDDEDVEDDDEDEDDKKMSKSAKAKLEFDDDEDDDDGEDDEDDEDEDDDDDNDEENKKPVEGDEEGSEEESDDEALKGAEAVKREKAIALAEQQSNYKKSKNKKPANVVNKEKSVKATPVSSQKNTEIKKAVQAPKETAADPKTPTHKQKRKSTALTPMSLDEAKDKIKSSKGPLPKTEEKFTNFCKNVFRIEESKTVKQLWKFAQENK